MSQKLLRRHLRALYARATDERRQVTPRELVLCTELLCQCFVEDVFTSQASVLPGINDLSPNVRSGLKGLGLKYITQAVQGRPYLVYPTGRTKNGTTNWPSLSNTWVDKIRQLLDPRLAKRPPTWKNVRFRCLAEELIREVSIVINAPTVNAWIDAIGLNARPYLTALPHYDKDRICAKIKLAPSNGPVFQNKYRAMTEAEKLNWLVCYVPTLCKYLVVDHTGPKPSSRRPGAEAQVRALYPVDTIASQGPTCFSLRTDVKTRLARGVFLKGWPLSYARRYFDRIKAKMRKEREDYDPDYVSDENDSALDGSDEADSDAISNEDHDSEIDEWTVPHNLLTVDEIRVGDEDQLPLYPSEDGHDSDREDLPMARSAAYRQPPSRREQRAAARTAVKTRAAGRRASPSRREQRAAARRRPDESSGPPRVAVKTRDGAKSTGKRREVIVLISVDSENRQHRIQKQEDFKTSGNTRMISRDRHRGEKPTRLRASAKS